MITTHVTHIVRILGALGVILLAILGHPAAFAQGDAPFDDHLEIRRTSDGAFTLAAGIVVVRIGNYPVSSDCHADLAIADPQFDRGNDRRGRVYYYRGDTGAPILTFVPPVDSLVFGRDITGLGDVNADGYPDIAISATLASSGEGVVFIMSGQNAGHFATINAVESSSSTFGESVAGLGDMDGRSGGLGFGLVIGSSGDQNGDGAAYVYEASNNGSTWTLRSTLSNSSEGITGLGTRVASAGHINSDGAVDIIVSGAIETKGTVVAGWQVYLNPVISLSANPSPLYEQDTTTHCIVGGVGDVDGDGIDDFAVARSSSGPIMEVFSGAGGARIGDVIEIGGLPLWVRGGVNYDGATARSVVLLVWMEALTDENVGHGDLYSWDPGSSTWFLDYEVECSTTNGPERRESPMIATPTLGGDVLGDTNLDGLTDIAVANNDITYQGLNFDSQTCVFYEDNQSYTGGWMDIAVSRLISGQTGTIRISNAIPNATVRIFYSFTTSRGFEQVSFSGCGSDTYVLLDDAAEASGLAGTADSCGTRTINFTVPSGWEDAGILIQAVQCGSTPWSRLVLRTVD